MGLSDLDKLKQLSWYTTVPLLVFAWIVQDKAYLEPEFLTLLGGLSTVVKYFTNVLGVLALAYFGWLQLISIMRDSDKIFTLLLATFILSVAGVGVGISLLKPSDVILPFNIYWFFGMGSVAFNLYELLDANIKAEEKLINDVNST